MKAARSSLKKAPEAAPVASPKKARRRKRQSGLRSRILEILAAGPISNAELQRQGHFTPSALYLHVKTLREQGLIDSQREGRNVLLKLKGKVQERRAEELIDAVVVQETPRNVTSPVSARMSPELQEALGAVAFRLQPVERVEEKLLVLDQLARSMPAAVVGVLHAVMNDLVKLSTLQPQNRD